MSTTELPRSWVGCEELWIRRPMLSSDSICRVTGLRSSLSLPPRSPKQTIQVSGIIVMRYVSIRVRAEM